MEEKEFTGGFELFTLFCFAILFLLMYFDITLI